MTTTLQRLVDYPHAAAFDKSPVADTVFRLRHPSGATWDIAETVMTASAGGVAHTYDLTTLTVGALAARLTLDGFDVSSLNSSYSSLSALVLVEGPGDQGISNGDRMMGYTSLMWALMGGYAGEIREARHQVVEALRQMVIGTSEGEWLDLWGKLYGVDRRDQQNDAAYRTAIPKEAFRIRVNNYAIEQTIKELTGYDVRIFEPWTQIFTLSHSTLSGPDRLQDGKYYQHCLIQPLGQPGVDWAKVLPIIERNRAAGVLIYEPGYQPIGSGVIYPSQDVVIRTAMFRRRVTAVAYEDRALIDFMNIEDLSIANNPFLITESRLHASYAKYDNQVSWSTIKWLPVPWTYSEIIVHTNHYRDYRVFGSGSSYESQTWNKVPSWRESGSWKSVNALISTVRTRTNL